MFPFRDANPSGTKPVVTIALIVANVVMFIHELSFGPNLDTFILHHALVPGLVTGAYHVAGYGVRDILASFLWTMFLHGGWLHLFFNMWYLWIFGDNVEDRLGHIPFLVFYLVAGAVGSVLQVIQASHSLIPMIGASGAIAGVLGAYVICFPHARITTLVPIFIIPLFIKLPAIFVLGFWFLLQLFSGMASLGATAQTGGVAWWAHIGGFLAGAILIRFLPPRKNRRQAYYEVVFDRYDA